MQSSKRPVSEMSKIHLTINGIERELHIEDRRLLVQTLREDLGLTGTHVGCDTTQCGACTVHVDGHAVKSCTILTVTLDGSEVITIEGLAPAGGLHPMQSAFHEHHGLQCGFCTPGMIMAAVKLVDDAASTLDANQVREGLEGNICRCTGYHNIVRAVLAAQVEMQRNRETIDV